MSRFEWSWNPDVAECFLLVLLDFSRTVDLLDNCEAQMNILDIRDALKACTRCKYSLKDVIEQFTRVETRFFYFPMDHKTTR